MIIFKRLLFVILFIPVCILNNVYDIIMFIANGDKHDFYKMLNWLSQKLL